MIARHPPQTLFVSADGRYLSDDASDPSIGGAKNQRVTAGVTRSPQADPGGIDLRPAFEIRYCATPVGDLPPGIDVLPGLPSAGTKTPVIVQQHDEARGRKRIRKSRNAVMPRAGVTMGHRDRGARLIALFRQIEPSAELYAAINCKFDVFTCRHISHLTRQRWRQLSAVF